MQKQKLFFKKSDEKKEVEKVSTQQVTLIQQRRDAKSLLHQYERIVKEQRKIISDLTTNLPKVVYTLIVKKFNQYRR